MYYKDFLDQFKDDPAEYEDWNQWLAESFAFLYKCKIYYGIDVKLSTTYGEPIEFIKQEDS